MTPIANTTPCDLADSLEFTEAPLQAASGGTWVMGRIAGHRFEALVFPQHAENPEWELGTSRISKLWLQHLADRKVVFSWDRGADVHATDAATQAIVDFLAAGLAEHTFGA
jgi:hypothetical protein